MGIEITWSVFWGIFSNPVNVEVLNALFFIDSAILSQLRVRSGVERESHGVGETVQVNVFGDLRIGERGLN